MKIFTFTPTIKQKQELVQESDSQKLSIGMYFNRDTGEATIYTAEQKAIDYLESQGFTSKDDTTPSYQELTGQDLENCIKNQSIPENIRPEVENKILAEINKKLEVTE